MSAALPPLAARGLQGGGVCRVDSGRPEAQGQSAEVYPARKVAARYLPRDLIDRPKQGFGFPLAIWMRTDMMGHG